MKQTYLLLSLVTCCFFANAQSKSKSDLKPFKVDLSGGYAIPSGSGAKGGVLVSIEPKYAVMPQISLGLRMEVAVVARFGGYDPDGNPRDLSVKASGGYLLTGDYYLQPNYSFRPFVGAGAGIFTLASMETDSYNGTVAAGTKFGGMMRAGIEAGHFRMGVEYNIIPSRELDGYDINGDPAKIKSKNSYLGIKIGVCLGGGRNH